MVRYILGVYAVAYPYTLEITLKLSPFSRFSNKSFDPLISGWLGKVPH